MASLLGPSQQISNPRSQSYAPLADEVDPSFGNIAPSPIVTRNGTIVYSKPLKRSSSGFSGNSGGSSDDATALTNAEVESRLSPFRSGSDETLSASVSTTRDKKGKGKEVLRVNVDDLRIRESGRSSPAGSLTRSAKGKEKEWDVERGSVDDHDVYPEPESYPPVNQEEEEERRIQANLARLAAQDQARRRARSSRILYSPNLSTPPPASTSTTTSFMRRPLSIISAFASRENALPQVHPQNQRNSLMGLVEGVAKDEVVTHQGWINGGTPLTDSPMTPSRSHHSDNPFTNPYDRHPPMSPTSPTIVVETPRASSKRPPNVPMSPDSPQTGGYDYAGPSWRGGAAAIGDSSDRGIAVVEPKRLPEKWWQALCSWGADLDGGYDGDDRDQAGRTNPFE